MVTGKLVHSVAAPFPHKVISTLRGPLPGVLRSPRALAEGSMEKKCFLHHRGRCTFPCAASRLPYCAHKNRTNALSVLVLFPVKLSYATRHLPTPAFCHGSLFTLRWCRSPGDSCSARPRCPGTCPPGCTGPSSPEAERSCPGWSRRWPGRRGGGARSHRGS